MMECGNNSESRAAMSDSCNFNISGLSTFISNMDTATAEELSQVADDCTTITQVDLIGPSVHQDEFSPSAFKLRKARYHGETKWLKVTARSRPPSEYQDFLLAAEEAFAFDNIDDLALRDEDDAIIEPTLFSFFPDTVFRLTRKVVYLPATPSDVTSLKDTASISGTSLASSISSASGHPGPAKKRKYESLEIFHDPRGRAGYISWRLRTHNRRRKDGKPSPKLREISDKENTIPMNVQPQNAEQAQAQVIFLRNTCPNTQKKEILVLLKDTFDLRRSAPDRILEEFPRFLDSPYLIDADFHLMYPDVRIENFNADAILRVHEKYS